MNDLKIRNILCGRFYLILYSNPVAPYAKPDYRRIQGFILYLFCVQLYVYIILIFCFFLNAGDSSKELDVDSLHMSSSVMMFMIFHSLSCCFINV